MTLSVRIKLTKEQKEWLGANDVAFEDVPFPISQFLYYKYKKKTKIKYPKELKNFIKENYCNSQIMNMIEEKFFVISKDAFNNICKELGVSVQKAKKEFLASHLHLCYDEIKNLYNAHFNTNHSRRDIMKMCHKRGLHTNEIYTKWAVYIDEQPTYVSDYVQGMFHATKNNNETDETILKICQINELCKGEKNVIK